MMKRVLLASCVSVMAASSPALGWESVCTQAAHPQVPVGEYPRATAPSCSPDAGPNTARQRWIGRLDEHRRLFELTRERAGLPAAVSDTLFLRVFTSANPVEVGGATLPSLQPVPFESATRVQTRAISIAELSQLPDFSYSFWDWAMGHETCPISGLDADPVACHDFSSHMGPVNANHFLPLAGRFYARYHQLAVARAGECAAMRAQLSGVEGRFEAFTRECEAEALALEAIAHHYLQDAWSMGHMWQRWGSPDLHDFEGESPLDQRDRAVLVALVSGMVHGSRGVLQALPEWTSFDVNDALTAPNPNVHLVSGAGSRTGGVGDDYLETLLTPEYEAQAGMLFACAESGLKQVYLASGGAHGALAPGTPVVGLVDPEGPACFGQRATNRAMVEAAAIQFKLFGVQNTIWLDSRLTGYLVPKVARSQGEVPVGPALKNQFRYGMQRWVSLARLAATDAPDGTEVANGSLGPLLGAEPNGAYADKVPLATYDEPELPWPGTPSGEPGAHERALALARVFHRGHARDWCERMDATALQALRSRVGSGTLDGDGRAAACEVCVEFASRHVRAGTDAATYDSGQEPLCRYLADGPGRYVYEPGAGEPLQLARTWCGCP